MRFLVEKNDKSKENKSQALMEWKKAYIESLINELHPSGNILEVGFGFGDAAKCIQSYHPISHTIIESNPQIAEEAKQWAAKNKNVTIIQDSWKNALSSLGKFESIFFNDYPEESELEFFKLLSSEETALVSDQAQEILEILEEQISQITMQFSDQEIDEFYQKVGKFNLKEMPAFLNNLKDRKNISDKQYKEVVERYHLGDLLKNIPIESVRLDVKPTDIMIDFLKECIAGNMQKGSRFSSFLMSPISKYEDSLFFDLIITNPEFDYREQLIPIQVPNFNPMESLVMIIEKRSE